MFDNKKNFKGIIMNVKLGKKIRELRKAKNISQEVLTIVSWN